MIDHAISALSPLDGRYAAKLALLRPLMSEQGFMHRRVQVEITWLIALSDSGMAPFQPFSENARVFLRGLVSGFTAQDALAIKEIEKTTNHDVKAVEYWLKAQCQQDTLGVSLKSELSDALEFIHFACTSEDINNTSHALQLKGARAHVILPALDGLVAKLRETRPGWARTARMDARPMLPVPQTRTGTRAAPGAGPENKNVFSSATR